MLNQPDHNEALGSVDKGRAVGGVYLNFSKVFGAKNFGMSSITSS